jgi:hypothetical protein
MEAPLTHISRISPFYPLNHEQLGTFKKERPAPVSRFYLACMIVVLTIGAIFAIALCATRLHEIRQYDLAAARI